MGEGPGVERDERAWKQSVTAMPRGISQATRALRNAAKPLGAAEERRAIRASVARLVGAEDERRRRFRVLWAAVHIDKPKRAGTTPARQVSVVIVDYDKARSIEFRVDSAGKVIDERDTEYRPPFAASEVKEAREIAGSDTSAATLVRKATVISPFAPDHNDGPRVIGLHLASATRGGPARLLGNVIVDLSKRRLVRIERAGDIAPGEGSP